MSLMLELNLSSSQWFDSWGEGPFSYDEVVHRVNRDPSVADYFHTTGGRTYRQVMDRMNAKWQAG